LEVSTSRHDASIINGIGIIKSIKRAFKISEMFTRTDKWDAAGNTGEIVCAG